MKRLLASSLFLLGLLSACGGEEEITSESQSYRETVIANIEAMPLPDYAVATAWTTIDEIQGDDANGYLDIYSEILTTAYFDLKEGTAHIDAVLTAQIDTLDSEGNATLSAEMVGTELMWIFEDETRGTLEAYDVSLIGPGDFTYEDKWYAQSESSAEELYRSIALTPTEVFESGGDFTVTLIDHDPYYLYIRQSDENGSMSALYEDGYLRRFVMESESQSVTFAFDYPETLEIELPDIDDGTWNEGIYEDF